MFEAKPFSPAPYGAAEFDEAGRSLVRYPLLLATAEQAEAAFAALSARGLVPGRWYRPLLFPGPADPAPFAYAPGSCPVAEDAAAAGAAF